MKRIVSLVMSLVILLTCTVIVSAGAETKIDYSYIKSNSDIYTFDIFNSGNAFINMDISRPTFTHKNSYDNNPSLFYSDIIIVDYYTSPKVVWRIWIDYVTKKSLGISSVSFQFNNTEYTFDVASNNITSRTDDYILEKIPLIMGSDNSTFWFSLLNMLEDAASVDTLHDIHIPITLHGAIDDITFEVPYGTLVFIFGIGEAMVSMVGTEGIDKSHGTACTQRNLAPVSP